MRGGVERAGRQRSARGPADSRHRRDQIVSPAALPTRIVSVRTASIVTVAGRASRKRMIAASRTPSPFGLTVVRNRSSPAKAAPLATDKPARSAVSTCTRRL